MIERRYNEIVSSNNYYFRGDNMKYSRQREVILEEVKFRYDHPTADMIYHSVLEKIPNISLGTVYRNLNQLVEHGLIRKILIPDDSDRFDFNLKNHQHLYCTCCKQVFDIESNVLKGIDKVIEKETNYIILSHEIVFTGICEACNRKKV